MNRLEKNMIEVLKDLKENHAVVGVKAEFEAEGTRLEEALRLKEVITRAGLDLTIKIGGCEALKDMYDARSIGVTRIVAPMVESQYALKKYLQCSKLAFPGDERQDVSFLVNVETIHGVRNFGSMLELPNIKDLAGIVIGRVDLVGSLNLNRDEVNSDIIFEHTFSTLQKAKQFGLEGVIGGGVAKESLPFFNRLSEGLLSRFETRKIIFDAPQALRHSPEKGLLKAVGFELMWLKNKRSFYGLIFDEDKTRLEMLEARYQRLILEAGGKIE